MNIFITRKNSGKKAFTLLEMLIVLTLVGILLSTVFSIIFVVLRQQVRIYRIIETRRQGDAILNFMKERLVRATGIETDTGVAICTPPVLPATYTDRAPSTGDDYVFIDSGSKYRFRLPAASTVLLYNDRISLINSPLHSGTVDISAFSITCRRNALNSTAIVQFSYVVTFHDPTFTPGEGTTVLNYRAKVKLR